jgi:bacillithiol biosynthesis deacetylase BshB1
MAVDILVFGPHPDDAEIGAGGLLLKMKSLGHRTGIVDMTTGDMGWGTPEQRLEESTQAARLLKLDVRENLDLGDCRVEDTFENRCKAAALIRKHQPRIVMAPFYQLPIGRGLGHNDHYKTGQIVANAYNLAHLRKAPIEGEPFQALSIFYYFIPPGTVPTFVVDVTPFLEEWMAAIDAHQTQFHHPDRPRPAHLPSVREVFETNARYWGWQVGVKFAQAYLSPTPLRIADPMALVQDIIPRP